MSNNLVGVLDPHCTLANPYHVSDVNFGEALILIVPLIGFGDQIEGNFALTWARFNETFLIFIQWGSEYRTFKLQTFTSPEFRSQYISESTNAGSTFKT